MARVTYTADDGLVFDTEAECLEHEDRLRRRKAAAHWINAADARAWPPKAYAGDARSYSREAGWLISDPHHWALALAEVVVGTDRLPRSLVDQLAALLAAEREAQ